MSPSSSSTWTAGFQPRRRGSHSPGTRASDAERSEVAELLSKHYSDGRLDQAEFDDRLGRAMNAKTHADFNGLFDDLPDVPGSGSGPGGKDAVGADAGGQVPVRRRQRSGNPLSQLLLFGIVAVAAIVIGHALVYSYVPWLVIGLLAFLWLRGDLGHRRH